MQQKASPKIFPLISDPEESRGVFLAYGYDMQTPGNCPVQIVARFMKPWFHSASECKFLGAGLSSGGGTDSRAGIDPQN